jgi:hypothetical protein
MNNNIQIKKKELSQPTNFPINHPKICKELIPPKELSLKKTPSNSILNLPSKSINTLSLLKSIKNYKKNYVK